MVYLYSTIKMMHGPINITTKVVIVGCRLRFESGHVRNAGQTFTTWTRSLLGKTVSERVVIRAVDLHCPTTGIEPAAPLGTALPCPKHSCSVIIPLFTLRLSSVRD